MSHPGLRVTGDAQPADPQRGSARSIRFKRMARAIELAGRCTSEEGRVSPKVGAVIVKDGLEIASAYRGEVKIGDHAEYTALVHKAGDQDLTGATVYTTLEPCTARNAPKQPCARRLIERQIARVVVGMMDPDPRIAGSGDRPSSSTAWR